MDPKTKKWAFNNPALAKMWAKAKVEDGTAVLNYLNKHHANGKILAGFGATPAPGTALTYLKTSNVNALHIHDNDKNIGTTFTIGKDNPLQGKTKLGHMTDKDINLLDGKLRFDKTTTGVVKVRHAANRPKMREFALRSVNDPEHNASLHVLKDAQEFMQAVESSRGKAAPKEEPMGSFITNLQQRTAMAVNQPSATPSPQKVSPKPLTNAIKNQNFPQAQIIKPTQKEIQIGPNTPGHSLAIYFKRPQSDRIKNLAQQEIQRRIANKTWKGHKKSTIGLY